MIARKESAYSTGTKADAGNGLAGMRLRAPARPGSGMVTCNLGGPESDQKTIFSPFVCR